MNNQKNDSKPVQGLIALDIDGTITDETHVIHPEVAAFLKLHYDLGWEFIFITGRSFQWAYQTLSILPFPYGLAVQNGALLFDIPTKALLATKQLDCKIIPKLEAISTEHGLDCVIYGGFLNNDRCFYRPDFYHPDLLSYLLSRKSSINEHWQEIEHYSELPLKEFASIKYFSPRETAESISQLISERLSLYAPDIRDPYDSHYCVIQATHPEATKGHVLEKYRAIKNIKGPIIAAGDDKNDLPMLLKATIPIVMSHAHPSLLEIAQIIAPPASQKGIITGLSHAIKKLS